MDDPHGKPDLDLINMVQQARMAHDADAKPSQVAAVYWIEVKPRDGGQTPTSRAGHWLIRTSIKDVDTVWAAIKAATERGELGYKSKVATASRDRANERLIYAMTYDADDADDVRRVGDALRALGLDDATYTRA